MVIFLTRFFSHTSSNVIPSTAIECRTEINFAFKSKPRPTKTANERTVFNAYGCPAINPARHQRWAIIQRIRLLQSGDHSSGSRKVPDPQNVDSGRQKYNLDFDKPSVRRSPKISAEKRAESQAAVTAATESASHQSHKMLNELLIGAGAWWFGFVGALARLGGAPRNSFIRLI
jgi:hypothetical protein